MKMDSTHPRGRPTALPVGRLRRVRTLAPTILGVLLLLGACQLGEAPLEPPAPAPDVVAMEGPAAVEGPEDTDPARMETASRLLTEGEDALRDRDGETALARGREVAREFGTVPGSAQALWLQARAYGVLEEWPEAAEAATRYLDRGPPTVAEEGEGRLFLARALLSGELDGGIETLFGLETDLPDPILGEAEELAQETASRMTLPVLRDLLREAPHHPRIYPAFQVEMSLRRALQGDEVESRELAAAALELEPGPEVRARARALAEGRLEDLDLAVLAMGAILSEGGPPSLRDLSAEIRAGVEVALSQGEAEGRPVRFQLLDDGASTARVAQLVEELEAGGATGILGPLEQDGLATAARARRGPTPVISPTARILPDGQDNILSLAAVDPAASKVLAETAMRAGIREVVLLHPRTEEMQEEARYFRQAFEGAGGVVRRVLVYPPGTTNFAEPFGEVVRLAPQGLVLLLPPGEIGLVAPQVAYFGVDDLEIQILGNESWSSEQVLSQVPPRHTDGVLSVSARSQASGYGPGWDDFVDQYENHFQRTIRSPVPALGYDAARLLLHASREGDGTAEGTAEALRNIRDFPGATGSISIVDGRIQRSYTPVRLQNREAVPFQP